jgi:hypothetical protein
MAASPGDHGHGGSNRVIALGAMVVVLVAGYVGGDSVNNIRLGMSVS